MAMQIIQMAHDNSGLLGWLTFERRNWLAIVLAGSVLGFAVGNGHTTQGAIQEVSAKAGCLNNKANVAQRKLTQAVQSATSDTVPTPTTSLPACPPLDLAAKN